MGIDPEELNFSDVQMSFAQKTITIDDVKSIVTVARENLRKGQIFQCQFYCTFSNSKKLGVIDNRC